MNESKSDTPMRRRSNARCERLSRASLHSKTSALSSCRICLSSIQGPAVLTCGHRFCEKCLKEYWSESERQDFIVCPLCRAYTANISFAKKEKPSADDFRKKFTITSEDISVANSENHSMMVRCLKISTIMTTLYYMVKWLHVPFLDLFMYFRTHLRFKL